LQVAARALQAAYGDDVDSVDLLVGGLAEDRAPPLPDDPSVQSLLGPLFT
jgi:hypothetical protein